MRAQNPHDAMYESVNYDAVKVIFSAESNLCFRAEICNVLCVFMYKVDCYQRANSWFLLGWGEGIKKIFDYFVVHGNSKRL